MPKKRIHTPLGDLLERKVAELAGGSQSEFGRRAELPRTTINRIIQGVTTLPEADVRRKLAAAMGIRHIDIFVLAGELREDEVPQPGAPRDPFPVGDVRAEIVKLLDEEAVETDDWLLVRGYIRRLVSAARVLKLYGEQEKPDE